MIIVTVVTLLAGLFFESQKTLKVVNVLVLFTVLVPFIYVINKVWEKYDKIRPDFIHIKWFNDLTYHNEVKAEIKPPINQVETNKKTT